MTISSMTGYATLTRETTGGTLTIELKSVNSRFLDLQFRINDELRAFEPLLREAIMLKATRGKVECRLSFGRKASEGNELALNQSLLATLADLQGAVRSQFIDAAPLSVHELLRWPGVLAEPETNQDGMQAEVKSAIQDVLSAFVDSRQREGAALKTMLITRIDDIEAIVEQITPLIPQLVTQFQQKAVERMQKALGLALEPADATITNTPSLEDMQERIRQEVTLYGIRIDVAEELNRLAAHLQETRHILSKGGLVGKRLDFMMQELNREANTLGSKAAAKELADAAMAMKLLIEQMREQVQNLE